ncbi:MAG TPA: hypothetical protein VGK19_25295 [Capsulimonadaceae bacterium]
MERPDHIRPMAFVAVMDLLSKLLIVVAVPLGLVGAYYALKSRSWLSGLLASLGVALSLTPLETMKLGFWVLETQLGVRLAD